MKINRSWVCISLFLLLVGCSGQLSIHQKQGEFQNSFTTQITEARFAGSLGHDKTGREYALLALGQVGRSESLARLHEDEEDTTTPRLNYNREFAGLQVAGQYWRLAVMGSKELYRAEAELSFDLSDDLEVRTGVNHQNLWHGGQKQTTLYSGVCWQLSDNLCGWAGGEIRNNGRGADSVEDAISIGLEWEW